MAYNVFVLKHKDIFEANQSWSEIEQYIEQERIEVLKKRLEISASDFVESYNKEYHSTITCIMKKQDKPEILKSNCDKVRSEYIQKVARKHSVKFKSNIDLETLDPGKFFIQYKVGSDIFTVVNLSFVRFIHLYEDLTTVTGKFFNNVSYKGTNFEIGYRSSRYTNELLEGGYHIYRVSNCTLAALRLYYMDLWGYDDISGKQIIQDINEKYLRVKIDAKSHYDFIQSTNV